MPIEIRELRTRVAVNEPETENTAAESLFAFGDGFLGGIDAPASSFAYAQAGDGAVWTGGRDVLIGGLGADNGDAAASINNRGHLVVGVDHVDLKAMFDGFDLV